MYKILLLIILFIIIIFIKNINNTQRINKKKKNIEYFKNKKNKNKGKKSKDYIVKHINKKKKLDWNYFLEDFEEDRRRNANRNQIDNIDKEDDNYIEQRMKPLPLRNKDYNQNNISKQKNNDNIENYDNVENYGFSKQNNLDENNKSFININFKKIFIFIFIFIILLTLSLSGYIAWNEFYEDPIWIKLMKTWLAILFCPAYLTYIFFKSILFNLNTNSMMK